MTEDPHHTPTPKPPDSNRPARESAVPSAAKPAGPAGCLIGALLLTAGAGMFAFWLLFMSWSHSFSSPGFARQEAIMKTGGLLLAVAGLVVLAWWWSTKRQSEPPA